MYLSCKLVRKIRDRQRKGKEGSSIKRQLFAFISFNVMILLQSHFQILCVRTLSSMELRHLNLMNLGLEFNEVTSIICNYHLIIETK
jgi:hypothetical protein